MYQSLPFNDSEELLRKTSQLHEALRNRKLLKFALLQAKTMRAEVPERVVELTETLRSGEELLQADLEEIKAVDRQAKLLKAEIEQQKNELNQLQQEQQLMERQIRRQNHYLEKKGGDSSYPSVEQMRLHGNNSTHQAHLQQLKQQIRLHKVHLQQIKNKKEAAQRQQQALSSEMKRQNGLLSIREKENVRSENFRSVSEKRRV